MKNSCVPSRVLTFTLLFVSFYSISITSSPGQSLETGKEQLWNQVSSWAYQLQSPSPDEIAKSPYDLVVIDYSSDGSVDGQFSPSDLKKMQKREGKADRLVIAYMSIGEAEPYRFYWKKSWNTEKPFWLLKPNPKWPDNYRVQYWNGEWKKILFGSDSSYLDRIVDAGFDGVYLDIVDGYEAFQKKDKYARQNMIDLVKAIADYARNVKGKKNFGVFPQNAPELIKDPSYLAVINGIGKEEVYFLDTDEASPDEDREWDEKLLKKLTASGRLVLAVDYCEDKENIAEAQRRCKENGFLSYCTTVELDKLSPK